MAKILITGGTGLIGKEISSFLTLNGHEVLLLTRFPSKTKGVCKEYKWDPEKGFIDGKELAGVEYIVNLAGAGIAEERWSEERKKEIIKSRTAAIDLLKVFIKNFNPPLKGIVGASATGFYGAVTSEKIYSEYDLPGSDFLADTCIAWESAYGSLKQFNVPVYVLRIGIVLSSKGGAYPRMVKPYKFGFGAAIGSGKQYMPWIHIQDLILIINRALSGGMPEGIYNCVAPEHADNKSFSIALARSFNKQLILPNIPSVFFKLIFGEMSCMLLEGSRVSSEKLRHSGFQFRFPELKLALQDLAN